MPNHDDKTFILAENWPNWPVLPVKRKNNSLEDKNLGVLLATRGKGQPYKVYHVYMFDMPRDADGWSQAPRTEYATLDEMLADGWIVD